MIMKLWATHLLVILIAKIADAPIRHASKSREHVLFVTSPVRQSNKLKWLVPSAPIDD